MSVTLHELPQLEPTNALIALENAFDPVAKIRTILFIQPYENLYEIKSYFDPRITKEDSVRVDEETGLAKPLPLQGAIGPLLRQSFHAQVEGSELRIFINFQEHVSDFSVRKLFSKLGVESLAQNWRALFVYQALVGFRMMDDFCRIRRCATAALFLAPQHRELLGSAIPTDNGDTSQPVRIASMECDR